MRIGITGHQRLADPDNWHWVGNEVDLLLSRISSPLFGISCLAIGADQLFARAILRHRGTLEVIIPFAGYELTFAEGAQREEFERLVKLARLVNVLEKRGSQEEAYLTAGQNLVDRSELVMAIWDGKPAQGPGGTADIVNYAIGRHQRIIHLNPILHETKELAT